MSLRENIFSARDEAMKQRNTAALNTLRVLCSEIKNKEIDLKHELSDEEILGIIKTQVKRLREANNDFAAAGRDDLVQANEQEIELLSQYLPEQMSEEQICAIIEQVLKDAGDNPQLGQIMGKVMQQVAGQAEGNRVRELVQQRLSS